MYAVYLSKLTISLDFRHAKFSSFVRQLNSHGYSKTKNSPKGNRNVIDNAIWEFEKKLAPTQILFTDERKMFSPLNESLFAKDNQLLPVSTMIGPLSPPYASPLGANNGLFEKQYGISQSERALQSPVDQAGLSPLPALMTGLNLPPGRSARHGSLHSLESTYPSPDTATSPLVYFSKRPSIQYRDIDPTPFTPVFQGGFTGFSFE